MKSKRKQLFLDLPIIFLLIAAACLPTPSKAIPTDSLDYVLYYLRSRGHSLFANAISTSDLLFDVLSLPSLTLLPPSDPALFALDMTESPALYLAVLRLHVIPFRLDLRYLQNNALVHTMVPSRRLHATRGDPNAASAASSLRLDGVEVLFPALLYSSIVSVYGLQGMLPSRVASVAASSPPPFQWLRPPPAAPRHRNRNRNRNGTIIPPLVPITNPVPITQPVFPRRAPISSGASSASPDDRNEVLDFHPIGRNLTVHNPPANQEAPALSPLSSPVNTGVSSINDSGGLASPPTGWSSPTAEMSLPPAVGSFDNPTTALGSPPMLQPSPVDGDLTVLAPSPVALAEALPPDVCPPVNLMTVAVMVPASQSPQESGVRQTPSPGGGWTGRNVGEAITFGNDYPVPKRDDDDWEVSAGGLTTESASGAAWDHVSTRDDYEMLGPNEADYGND